MVSYAMNGSADGSRKRRRLADVFPDLVPQQGSNTNPESVQDHDDLSEADIPSDVMAAVLLLRQEFQHAAAAGIVGSTAGTTRGSKVLPTAPLLLKSHLYTLLTNRTQADQEIDELRRSNSLRMFKLPTGADEHALMLTQDYVSLLESHASKQAEKERESLSSSQDTESSEAQSSDGGEKQKPMSVFLRLAHNVLPRCTDVSITKPQLLQLLSAPAHTTQAPSQRLQPSSLLRKPIRRAARCSPCDEDALSALLTAGFLTRHPLDEAAFLFCTPDMGSVVKSIGSGRRELQTLLARRKYGEIKESDLLARIKLRGSALGTAWHVRDLLGRGVVKKLQTTSGAFLRLVKQ